MQRVMNCQHVAAEGESGARSLAPACLSVQHISHPVGESESFARAKARLACRGAGKPQAAEAGTSG